MDLKQRFLNVHQRLLDFYGYPEWRDPLPPLDELISTILSQNTNDQNRDRAFAGLQEHFPGPATSPDRVISPSRFSSPDWEAVRDADEQQVIQAIRPAGLANQKGPRIQNVLREITAQRGSLDLSFLAALSAEEAREWLLRFKGVGPKTAAIVLQFALGLPAFPVDTHIYRVSGRLGLRPDRMSVEHAHDHLAQLIPPEAYYAAHLNLIRLGREICQARRPRCSECPLKTVCDYFAAL